MDEPRDIAILLNYFQCGLLVALIDRDARECGYNPHLQEIRQAIFDAAINSGHIPATKKP